MESEKVSRIKNGLERYKDMELFLISDIEIPIHMSCADILTLINELESENERLNKALVDNLEAYKDGFNEGAGLKNGVDDKLKTENQQLKDRIALLEKDNELLRNAKVVYETVDYCYEDLKKAEKRIAELEKEIEENAFYSKGYADGIKNTYEAMLPQKLENFAERLKEKKVKLGERFNIYDIDETLKECIK